MLCAQIKFRTASMRILACLDSVLLQVVPDPTSLEERLQWAKAYSDKGPHRILVAEDKRRLLGCAYSSVYRTHPAFRETVETSIYLDPEARGRGVGTRLYESLFALLEQEPVHLAVAGIALPNEASVRLHKKVGFTEVGVFQEYAEVNGKYFSSIWLQRFIPQRQNFACDTVLD